MSPLAAAINATVTCSTLVTESHVLGFAEITGDFSPNHVDEEAMRKTVYGGRIAHGALLIGYMSRASTLITDHCGPLMQTHYPVSLGYDRVRILNAVKMGDTVNITYTITSVDEAKMRSNADVRLTNQHGTLCAVATHLMSWLVRN